MLRIRSLTRKVCQTEQENVHYSQLKKKEEKEKPLMYEFLRAPSLLFSVGTLTELMQQIAINSEEKKSLRLTQWNGCEKVI